MDGDEIAAAADRAVSVRQSTWFRRNGIPQLTIVRDYWGDGGVGVSIAETRMKLKNLLRRSLLVPHVDWWSGLPVFERTVEMVHSGSAAPKPFARRGDTSSARPRDGAARTG